jgi:hypothetical protein
MLQSALARRFTRSSKELLHSGNVWIEQPLPARRVTHSGTRREVRHSLHARSGAQLIGACFSGFATCAPSGTIDRWQRR